MPLLPLLVKVHVDVSVLLQGQIGGAFVNLGAVVDLKEVDFSIAVEGVGVGHINF